MPSSPGNATWSPQRCWNYGLSQNAKHPGDALGAEWALVRGAWSALQQRHKKLYGWDEDGTFDPYRDLLEDTAWGDQLTETIDRHATPRVREAWHAMRDARLDPKALAPGQPDPFDALTDGDLARDINGVMHKSIDEDPTHG